MPGTLAPLQCFGDMLRVYFHIRDGDLSEIDPQGVEFASLEHEVIDAKSGAGNAG